MSSRSQRLASWWSMLLKFGYLRGEVSTLVRRAAGALQDGVLDQAEEDALVEDFRGVLRAARNR